MSPTYGTPSRMSPPEEAELVDRSQSDQTLVPYDENLLERARIQWQFGDWASLVRLDRDTLQHHPDRAKLALLAAAGQLQTGGMYLAREFIRLAEDWGCSKKLIMQILAAGVHNSLGRAAAHTGNLPRAFKHFENAIGLGSSGTDTRLMLRARAREQLVQLGLSIPEHSFELLGEKTPRDAPISFKVRDASRNTPISVEAFFSDSPDDRPRSLEELKRSLDAICPEGQLPELGWVSVQHRSKCYFFAHFEGDYIPGKMAEKGQFYESPFLNLLARLHQPGKLIVDGGANIGNHAVFFAGVIGAPVIAFEPQPFNHGLLAANVHLNRLEERIDARRIALGNQAGRISLVQAIPDNYGSFTADTSLVRQRDGDALPATPFEVPLSTLDAELADHMNAVSIIKLDLEGMELDALRGARSLINESLPVIAVECFTRSLYQKIKEFLADFDYFAIDSTNATPTFIFLTRKNPRHLEMLSKYLEMSSVGKFASHPSFKDPA